jgi:hypothetical protein
VSLKDSLEIEGIIGLSPHSRFCRHLHVHNNDAGRRFVTRDNF